MKNIQGKDKDLELFNKDGKTVYRYYKRLDGYIGERTYDSNGKVLTYKDSSGFSCEKTYDSNGNTLTYKNSNGYSWEYTRDSKGNILTYKDSTGVTRGFNIPEKTNIWSDEDMMFSYEQGARLALISQSDFALIIGNLPTKEEWLNDLKNISTLKW